MAELGRGSFGSRSVVARRKKETWLIAVKVVDKRHAPGLARSLRELPAVVHPFVARSLWWLETDARTFVATELYSASVAELAAVNGGSFQDREAVFYCAEVALALGYLHSRGVAHRALKPSNVLLDKRGHVALHDVLGRVNDHLTASMLPFLAPERLKHDQEDDQEDFGGDAGVALTIEGGDLTTTSQGSGVSPFLAAADWWSFGVLAYRLLAGRTPFFHAEPRRHFANILNEDPDFCCASFAAAFPHLGGDHRLAAASTTLKALLEKDPTHRLHDPAAVKASPWFADVNWDDALRKLLPPPHTPHFLLYHEHLDGPAGDLGNDTASPRTTRYKKAAGAGGGGPSGDDAVFTEE